MVLKVTVQYSIPGTSLIKKSRARAKRPIQDVEFADAVKSVLTFFSVAAIVVAAPLVVCSLLAAMMVAAKTSVELATMEDMA